MSLVKGFLDMIGATLLWIDFAIQGVGVMIRFLTFGLLSLIFPFCGKRDFEWNLQWKPLPQSTFCFLWLGGVFILFWSTAIWPLVTILILECLWSLYALVNGKGERRREIFFHTLAIQVIGLLLFIGFLWGTEITHWRSVDLFQHHGNREAWLLTAFLVIRVGLFPFHVNRLDYFCEISLWPAVCQTVFNAWIVFQTGLLVKTVGFKDAFGDWSPFLMGWCIVSVLFALGLTAVQERTTRWWAHLYWMIGHVALYITTL